MLFLGAGLEFVQGKIRIRDGQPLFCNLSAPAPGIHAQAVDVVSEALLLVAEVFSLLFEVSSSLAGVAQRHALFGDLLLREEQFGRARRLYEQGDEHTDDTSDPPMHEDLEDGSWCAPTGARVTRARKRAQYKELEVVKSMSSLVGFTGVG